MGLLLVLFWNINVGVLDDQSSRAHSCFPDISEVAHPMELIGWEEKGMDSSTQYNSATTSGTVNSLSCILTSVFLAGRGEWSIKNVCGDWEHDAVYMVYAGSLATSWRCCVGWWMYAQSHSLQLSWQCVRRSSPLFWLHGAPCELLVLTYK